MSNFVQLAAEKKASEFKTQLEAALTTKIAAAIEAKKAEIATNIFTEQVVNEDGGGPYHHMSHEAMELVLHGDSTHHLNQSSHEPIMKNLRKKASTGKYKPELAQKLWRYHADRVAQDYHREHGSPDTPWHKAFTTTHRNQAAKHWEESNRNDVHMTSEQALAESVEPGHVLKLADEFKGLYHEDLHDKNLQAITGSEKHPGDPHSYVSVKCPNGECHPVRSEHLERVRRTDGLDESVGKIKKGAFHRWLGKSEDEPITRADIAKGKAAGGHAEKMAIFAQNFGGHNLG